MDNEETVIDTPEEKLATVKNAYRRFRTPILMGLCGAAIVVLVARLQNSEESNDNVIDTTAIDTTE